MVSELTRPAVCVRRQRKRRRRNKDHKLFSAAANIAAGYEMAEALATARSVTNDNDSSYSMRTTRTTFAAPQPPPLRRVSPTESPLRDRPSPQRPLQSSSLRSTTVRKAPPLPPYFGGSDSVRKRKTTTPATNKGLLSLLGMDFPSDEDE